MQLDAISIALRQRAPWEATDLGIALVRRHAGVIYAAWAAITLPVCLLFSASGVLLEIPWLAPLLLWWLKPIFDRIPLFVLSRAVFGQAPTWRETVRAQRHWGWRAWRWLHWRRLHPGRALLLPVDVLEAQSGAQRSARCRVLSKASGAPSTLLTIVAVHIEMMLYVSIFVLGLMFVPIEFMSDSAQAMFETLFEAPPVWAKVVMDLIYWLTISIMEPFYIGAGFGLYLNRRTQLEAWDIELAFRRLALRLRGGVSGAVLALILVLGSGPDARAETLASQNVEVGADNAASDQPLALQKVFAGQYHDEGEAFESSVNRAYTNDDLNPKKTIHVWKLRRPAEDVKPTDTPSWLKSIGMVIGFMAEYGLWILLGILAVLIIRYANRWIPWISDRFEPRRELATIETHDIQFETPLPNDVVAAVRALWSAGEARKALALLYRAAVQRLSDRLGSTMPKGATESQCLRAARSLTETDARLFAAIVRNWQAIAYAQRSPSEAELEALLQAWQQPLEATS